MERRTYGGARKISIELRPRSCSKSRKTTRRRHTPTSNTVVLPDPPKQSHLHSGTNFPLFSSNLLHNKPPIPQAAKLTQVSQRNRQTVNHVPRLRSSAGEPKSPTPVEIYSSRGSRVSTVSSSLISLSSLSNVSMKSGLVHVAGKESDIQYSSPVPSYSSPIPGDDISHCSEEDYSYNDKIFPFQYLPEDCKLKVFSLLSSHDKGRAAQVCANWWTLMQLPGLWAHVSFSDFPFWCITTDEHNCIGNCYIRYRVRVKQFLAFLKDLKPILRSLEFKFDIGEKADGFLSPLESLIDKSNTRDLKYASLNWKETPMRPFWTDMTRPVPCDEMMQKHRLRQRDFVNFFDLFTKKCLKLETLVLPFDWSDKSVDCLLRLKNLKSLVLEKYFVFQKLCQDLLDRLLIGLDSLKQLMLEVWTPSGHGLVFFSLVSKSIEYLDISQSRGFYVSAVHLPKLKVFRVARHPWNGPLVLADRINVPCLYDVLASGAHNLEKINEHILEPSWRDAKYENLERVLKSVCSCRSHKSGWAM